MIDGDDKNAFERLLSYPHAFIFHRNHYDHEDGRGTREEYESLRRRFSDRQERELLRLLAEPIDEGARREKFLSVAGDRTVDRLVREAIRYHSLEIRGGSREVDGRLASPSPLRSDRSLPDEEDIVEDAGLFDHDDIPSG